jgi:prepilin-type processing-associated H-X9-DG protein
VGRPDGANLWGKANVTAPGLGFFGAICNDPNTTTDDIDGQIGVLNCKFTVGGVTRDYFQPPSVARPRDQQHFWNIYPNHTGGICNVVFGDGSIRSVSNGIDILAFSAFVTPSAGEVNTNLD